jgi:hypothetical protein
MCFKLIGEDRYECLFYKLSVVEFCSVFNYCDFNGMCLLVFVIVSVSE